MSESWEEIKCEKCNTYNWYCIGDVGDLSIPDIDGTECYKCGHKEVIEEYIAEEHIDFKLGIKDPTRNK